MDSAGQCYSEDVVHVDASLHNAAMTLGEAVRDGDVRRLARQACLSAMEVFEPIRVGLTCSVEDVFVTVCFLLRGDAPSELMVDGNLRTGFVLPRGSISESVRSAGAAVIRNRREVSEGPLAQGLVNDGQSHALVGLPWYRGFEMGGTLVMWFDHLVCAEEMADRLARFGDLLSVALSSSVMVGERGVISGVAGLSPREHQTLRAIGEGRTNKEIALELGISLNTVKEYVRSVFKKTGCRNRSEAAAFASRSGMLNDER